jgi:hypothetical protein
MKTLEWDNYEFKVAAHFLAAMINGDFSGMTSDECMAYRTFEQAAYATAKASGLTVGHWADDPDDSEGNGYGVCAITGEVAGRVPVKLMCYRAVDA